MNWRMEDLWWSDSAGLVPQEDHRSYETVLTNSGLQNELKNDLNILGLLVNHLTSSGDSPLLFHLD